MYTVIVTSHSIFYALHQNTFFEDLKGKPSVCVRLQQNSLVNSHKNKICPDKPMQTYHRRLLSTWLHNRYFSMFNVTASTPLWYFSARQSFQHASVQQGNPEVHHVRFGSCALIWLFLLLKCISIFPWCAVVFAPQKSHVFLHAAELVLSANPTHRISTNKLLFTR